MGKHRSYIRSQPEIWAYQDSPSQLHALASAPGGTGMQFNRFLSRWRTLGLFSRSGNLSDREQGNYDWIPGIAHHFLRIRSGFHGPGSKFSLPQRFQHRIQSGGFTGRGLPGEFRLPTLLFILTFLLIPANSLFAKEWEKRPHPNPVYQEWLNSYEGKFEPLKYTEISYRGNRRANGGRERLAPFSNQRERGELSGNYFLQAGPEQTLGLDQNLAVPELSPGSFSTQGIHFKPRGFQVRLSKRLFHHGKIRSHLDFSFRQSSATVAASGGSILRIPTGERVDSINGSQDNYFFNLDWTLRKPLAQKQRYHAEILGGVRFSDTAVKVNATGTRTNPSPTDQNLVSSIRDYHFRNLGIGPFLGFRANTPITNKVSTGLTIKQVLLPSKGNARFSRFNQDAGGATLVNESNSHKQFTSFPITELNWDLNFHFDQSKKLYLGYAYSHWNFYEIQGFGSDNFRDLTLHGPRAALQFLF